MYRCDPVFFDHSSLPHYQAEYKGFTLDGYYFVLEDDTIHLVSHLRGRAINLKPHVSGRSKYPKIGVRVGYGSYKTIHVHQIVAQTFHAFPIPDGVTASEWERTPESVKNHFSNHYWEANHIDHNHLNYHPDNLEWVSRGVNVDKYHIHRIS